MKQNKNSYFCTSCAKSTPTWYINSKTLKRAKYCSACYSNFSPTERKQNEKKYIFNIIANMQNISIGE